MSVDRLQSVREFVFPMRCALCRSAGLSPCWLCQIDIATFPLRTLPRTPLGCASVSAAYEYAGAVRQLIRAAKYGHNPASLSYLARHVAMQVPPSVLRQIDCITWVPTSDRRRRARGFDQAETLARYVAVLVGLPVRQLLAHVPDRGSQTGRTRAERLARSNGQLFVPHNPAEVAPYAVLLIDDVVTTGGTLSAAARSLREHGSFVVHAAAVAVTP